MLQLKIGVQLECLKLPFRQALRAAAEMGVDAVEINARSELRPDELTRTGVRHIRKLLADLNLSVCSIQFPTRRGYGDVHELEKRIDATKQVMSAAFELNSRVVVNPTIGIPETASAPEWPILIQALSDLGRHGHRVGTWLAARTGVESGDRLANLIGDLPDGTLAVDFDPGSLIINGHSAESAMQKLAGHVVSFRAFDAARDASGRGIHVQLGRGSVDFPLLFSMLEEKHFNGYVVIERHVDRDSIASCQQTIQYLKSLF